MRPIGLDSRSRDRAGLFLASACGRCRYRYACCETLQIDGEIDARQRLIKIVHVEQDIVLGSNEGAEVHQVAVAACLHRYSGHWLGGQVCRHHRGGAAQERERVDRHARITLRHKLRNAIRIALGENCNGIARHRSFKVGMCFSRRLASERFAHLEPLGTRTQSDRHLEVLQ